LRPARGQGARASRGVSLLKATRTAMRTADSMPTLPHGRGGLHTLTTFRRPRASGLFARPVSPSTRTAEHTRLYLSKCSATLASTRVPRTSAVLGRHGDAARRLTHIGPVCAVDKPPHGRRLAPPRQRFWCGKRVRPNGRSLARSYARSRAAQRGEHCAPLMTQPRSPCQQEKEEEKKKARKIRREEKSPGGHRGAPSVSLRRPRGEMSRCAIMSPRP